MNAQDSSWSTRLRDASRTESTCDLDQPSALTCQNRNPRFRAKPLKLFRAGEGNRTLVFSLEVGKFPQCFQKPFRHFAAFWAIEINTEFLFVGMAIATQAFILCSAVFADKDAIGRAL
jgi:hypothetical protein